MSAIRNIFFPDNSCEQRYKKQHRMTISGKYQHESYKRLKRGELGRMASSKTATFAVEKNLELRL